MMRRLGQFLLWVDYQTDGIRARLFVAAAVVQVCLAPLWDLYLPFARVAGGMEPMTFLATLNFILLSSALLGGRLLAMSSSEDGEDRSRQQRSTRGVWATAVSLASRYIRLMWLESWPAFASRIGAGVCVTLMALRGSAGLLRWSLWKGMRVVEELFGTGELSAMRSALTTVYWWEQSVLKWVVRCSIPIALLAAWALLRKAKRSLRPTALREPRALKGVEPLIERRKADSHHDVASAFRGDLVTRLLQHLAEWEPSHDADDEQSCRDELAFYLQRHNYQVSIERWIAQGGERRRVDLIVEDSLPIEMKYALHKKGAGERDRARSQIECYARMWGDVGPVFLLLVATPSTEAVGLGKFALQWNANLDGTCAPVVVISDSHRSARAEHAAAA